MLQGEHVQQWDSLSFDWVEELLTRDPSAMSHTWLADDFLILTAYPDDMRTWIATHLGEKGMFEEGLEMWRMRE